MNLLFFLHLVKETLYFCVTILFISLATLKEIEIAGNQRGGEQTWLKKEGSILDDEEGCCFVPSVSTMESVFFS